MIRSPLHSTCLLLTLTVCLMKLTYLFSAFLLSMLSGCAANSASFTGAVFHTSSGQSITAATTPEFRNGHYIFVDATGTQQSLYLSQIMSVSR
jgi:hypothetical protein